MKDNNDNRSIHPGSQCASSLKKYNAPCFTSYGDITVLTKANAPNNHVVDAQWSAGATPNKSS